jgi:integrase
VQRWETALFVEADGVRSRAREPEWYSFGNEPRLPAFDQLRANRLAVHRLVNDDALLLHGQRQDQIRARCGDKWHDNNLVFASRVGTALDAGNVRRAFRKVTAAAGLDPAEWTPRELRHSFVSLLSDAGVPVEKVARLVGHIGTATTELVYRKQIRPVVTGGAAVMDQLFPRRDGDA